jgi:hypothetical protein
MKSFKVFIATAVVTLSASMSIASMSQRPDQVNACVYTLMNNGLVQVDQAQAQRSCLSGLREDGAGFATCMANMAYIGLPLGMAQANSPKAITATEVCSTRTDTDLVNCVFQKRGSMQAEESVRTCVVLTGSTAFRPQSQLTNGNVYVPPSDEEVNARALQEYHSRLNGTLKVGGQYQQHSAPVQRYESAPQSIETSDSISDLPEVQ